MCSLSLSKKKENKTKKSKKPNQTKKIKTNEWITPTKNSMRQKTPKQTKPKKTKTIESVFVLASYSRWPATPVYGACPGVRLVHSLSFQNSGESCAPAPSRYQLQRSWAEASFCTGEHCVPPCSPCWGFDALNPERAILIPASTFPELGLQMWAEVLTWVLRSQIQVPTLTQRALYSQNQLLNLLWSTLYSSKVSF